jgi:hypothetical protein
MCDAMFYMRITGNDHLQVHSSPILTDLVEELLEIATSSTTDPPVDQLPSRHSSPDPAAPLSAAAATATASLHATATSEAKDFQVEHPSTDRSEVQQWSDDEEESTGMERKRKTGKNRLIRFDVAVAHVTSR